MVLYFSGTGNSRAVAAELGHLMDEPVRFMEPGLRGGRMGTSHDRHLIWVFPVYSWGVPPYVLDVMRSVDIVSEVPLIHHAVMTCGDDCGLADRMWRKTVTGRGWQDGCVMSVQMPNNYVCLPGFDVDPEKIKDAKLAAFRARVRNIVDEIMRAETSGHQLTDIVRGAMPWIKTRVIYPLFVRYAIDPRRFAASEACVGCRRCASTCPLCNIKMVPSHGNEKALRPTWGNDCAGCLGCYHICPTHAISYTRATRNKGQYHLR